ncbi:MAG TPA: hypothetical protein VME46_02875 [Acidimicrobiales bacterium]|nr:hypothetical protein [Acidimicrobiales bacterium]
MPRDNVLYVGLPAAADATSRRNEVQTAPTHVKPARSEGPDVFPAGGSDRRGRYSSGEVPAIQLLSLQATVGNAAVAGLLRPHTGTGAGLQVCEPQPPGEPPSTQRSVVGDLAGEVAGAVGGLWDDITSRATSFGVDLSGIDVSALGADMLSWLKSAGSSVWSCLKALGKKAVEILVAVGTAAFEKLSTLGVMEWTFISSVPVRLARLVIDSWEAIVGALSWLGSGLAGAAAEAWDALLETFKWLAQGLEGALGWLGGALAGAAGWALDFVTSPSTDKLLDGMLAALSWVWDGIGSFKQWSWQGLAAAAEWAKKGTADFAKWLWDGVIEGAPLAGEIILHLMELVGVGEALEILYGLFNHLQPLSGAEVGASSSVHPPGLIPYELVRVDQDSVLIKIGTKLAAMVKSKVLPGAITTMHIIHAPGSLPLGTAVHELTHVAQYQLVGAVYIPQALCAQQSAAGYNYGDLTALRATGKHFSDLNREQQAALCEDYYNVTNRAKALYGGTLASLGPFIADMRAGAF